MIKIEHFNFSSKLTFLYQNVSIYIYFFCSAHIWGGRHRDHRRAPRLLRPALRASGRFFYIR